MDIIEKIREVEKWASHLLASVAYINESDKTTILEVEEILIEKSLSKIFDFAVSEGLIIVEIYIDRGGSTRAKEKLLADIKKGMNRIILIDGKYDFGVKISNLEENPEYEALLIELSE